jgi:hypothetical protein
MPIEIEIRGLTEPTQEEEHTHYFAYCDSCWSVSEENGDYGPPPLELSWVPDGAALEQVISECEKHEKHDNKKHNLRIVGVVHSPHTDKGLE